MHFSFSLKYGRNQQKTAQFSIGIDLLGPDPTSSKNKAELKKNSQVARFTDLSKTSCNTNYTRRHKFITHKNDCCQVFSRSRNDQPIFVNEYKFKQGWRSSLLKTCFLDFADQNVNIFLANLNHTPRLLTNMSRRILTLGEL